MNSAEATYYVKSDGKMLGPWSFAEIRSRCHAGELSDDALVLINNDWRNLAEHLQKVEKLRKELTSHFKESARAHPVPPPDIPSIIVHFIVGGLWLWYARSEWLAVAALATAFTTWTLGFCLALSASRLCRRFGQWLKGVSWIMGIPAFIWLAYVLVRLSG